MNVCPANRKQRFEIKQKHISFFFHFRIIQNEYEIKEAHGQ